MGEERGGLKKGLSRRHVFFIALGSAIGTGLFYGSAKAINLAGPAVLIAYILSGAAVYIVMRALGEMVLHKPIPGSFGAYATRYLGPLAGFITGWTYIFEMALVCLADITAFAIYMSFWVPDTVVSPWIWTLGITLIITGLNLCAVKKFGEMEFWLSLIKVLAIIAMIGGGLIIMVFGIGSADHAAIGVSNLWVNGGFMPNGIAGLVASFAVVVFAFGGIEIIGLTASETQDADRNIPRAIKTVPSRILLFYVMALFVLMSLFPWNQIGEGGSPFVRIFESLGIKSAAHILNIVVITAAISAINSDLFGAARMMYGLSKDGQAPTMFTKISPSGVPVIPVLTMLVVLMVGVLLNYYMHDQLFFLIAAIATFATIWVWLMILCSHVAMRLKMTPDEVRRSKFPILWWPYASIAAIAFLVFVLVILGVNVDSRPALYSGLIWIAVLTGCYMVWVHKSGQKILFLAKDETPPVKEQGTP